MTENEFEPLNDNGEPDAQHAAAEPGFWDGARKTWVAFIGVFAASAAQAAVDITQDGAVTWEELVPRLTVAAGLGIAAAFAVWAVPNATA
jgi:hypothetical protein